DLLLGTGTQALDHGGRAAGGGFGEPGLVPVDGERDGGIEIEPWSPAQPGRSLGRIEAKQAGLVRLRPRCTQMEPGGMLAPGPDRAPRELANLDRVGRIRPEIPGLREAVAILGQQARAQGQVASEW